MIILWVPELMQMTVLAVAKASCYRSELQL